MKRWHLVFRLGLASWLVFASCASAAQKEVRLLFTGDILLSRNVALELEKRKTSPWSNLSTPLKQADFVFGNFEGAVGASEDCLSSQTNSPCFSISETYIPLLTSAGFGALSIENNHNRDLGQNGREATIKALRAGGLLPLSYDASPQFLHFGDLTIAVIALNLVPSRDGACQHIPSIEMKQKLRLARSLANLVVIYVHWGSELLDWPNKSQREGAEWLIRHGADLIVGHHPHVVQPPELVAGKPVFFSLGNHLFDQKYPATKEGLIADCRINPGVLSCQSLTTHTAKHSFFPELVDGQRYGLEAVSLTRPMQISGLLLRPVNEYEGKKGELRLEGVKFGKRLWQTRAIRLATITAARLDGKNELLFTLEWHYSPIDREIGLRPYVYSVTERGLIARWRGSALAWPLLDAMLLPEDEATLCGLHRGDSFIDLQPNSKEVRVAAYRWNGFGFSGVDDPAVTEKCRRCLEVVNREQPISTGAAAHQ